MVEKDLDHQHEMDNKRHHLFVVGQRWAGSLATIGVVGSVTALLLGMNGFAATVMTAEFVALVGLFTYRKKIDDAAETPALEQPVPAR